MSPGIVLSRYSLDSHCPNTPVMIMFFQVLDQANTSEGIIHIDKGISLFSYVYVMFIIYCIYFN